MPAGAVPHSGAGASSECREEDLDDLGSAEVDLGHVVRDLDSDGGADLVVSDPSGPSHTVVVDSDVFVLAMEAASAVGTVAAIGAAVVLHSVSSVPGSLAFASITNR